MNPKSLLRAAKVFDDISGVVPISFLIVFLLVATDEGHGINEYARRFGVDRRTMSRHLRSIGARYRKYGLVKTTKSRTNKSGKRVFLTAKGKRLLTRIITSANSRNRARSR